MNLDFLDESLPTLAEGAHSAGSGQMCAMELVAFIEREEHSDHPQCTCPVLAAYTRQWNDHVPGRLRNHILPLLPQLVGTRNDKYQIARAKYFAFAARDLACKALQGRIDLSLIEKLRNSKTMQECRAVALECRHAAVDAASSACAVANAAANAANAAANAASNAANAANDSDAAANAANVAAYASDAVSARAAVAAADQIWLDALETLKGAIALDPDHSPATWTQTDYVRGLEAMA